MRHARAALSIVSALFIVTGCASRTTPPPPAAPEMSMLPQSWQEKGLEEAELLYQDGIDLYRAGSWEEARPLFDRTVAILDEHRAQDYPDLRTRRSAALLRTKAVYYENRCREENLHEPVEIATAPALSQGEPPPQGIPFPREINSRVDEWIGYFCGRGRKDFTRWLERCGRYENMMKGILIEENLPTDLFYVALIESGMNPNAYSYAHAVGAWQFIRGTGRLYGLRSDWWYDDRRDPIRSSRAAAKHLKDLYESLGDWPLVLAAYNCGEARVNREIRRTGSRDFWKLSRLPRQTRNYVPKFLAALEIASKPEQYNFYFRPDPPHTYETITVNGTVSLEAIAHCAGSSRQEIELLNPAIRRSVTPPTKNSFYVHVPAGSASRVESCLPTLPQELRVTWEEYRVRRGDTLSDIANMFGTTTTALADINKLRSRHRIREGQRLLIPQRTRMGVPPSKKQSSSDQEKPDGKSEVVDAQLTRYRYPVRRGDTLSEIARRFHIKLSDLRRWNSIGRSGLIRPGEALTLFITAEKAKNFKLEADGGQSIVHVVRRGETLEVIGRRHGVSAHTLAGWNNMPVNRTIYPGNRLKIFPGDKP